MGRNLQQGVRANMFFTPEELEELRRADAEVDLEFSQAEVDGRLDEFLEDELDAELSDAALRCNVSHDEWRKYKRRLKRTAYERERARRLRRESPEYVQRLRENTARHYIRHCAEILERRRNKRNENKEEFLKGRRLYRQANQDTIRARARARYQKDPAKYLACQKRYRDRNRELIRARARLRRLLDRHSGQLYVLSSVELG